MQMIQNSRIFLARWAEISIDCFEERFQLARLNLVKVLC